MDGMPEQGKARMPDLYIIGPPGHVLKNIITRLIAQGAFYQAAVACFINTRGTKGNRAGQRIGDLSRNAALRKCVAIKRQEQDNTRERFHKDAVGLIFFRVYELIHPQRAMVQYDQPKCLIIGERTWLWIPD